ncbi:MAG: FtsX-like permease family protein, partial [bacterium]
VLAVRLEESAIRLGSALRDFFTALTAQMTEAEASLAEAEAQLAEAREKLEAGEAELTAARQQLDEGKAQYESGLAEYEAGEKAYAAGIAQGEKELREAEQKLTGGQTEYDEGLRAFTTAKSEYETKIEEAEEELSAAREKLDEAQRELDRVETPQVFVLGRWANVGYACFESDASIVSNVAKVFPVFFFLVAALICMTTISRMVDEQRSQLGVLLALGYSRPAVMAKYLLYAGAASVLGAGLGILLFSWAFPNIIWQAYSIMYDFTPRLTFTLNVPLSLATFFGYVAAMLLVTWLSLRKELGDMPANIIRPKPPKLGKRVLLERIPFIWNRLDFMRKVTLRNIFRYKSRVAMMILGIGGCTALMITGYGIRDSIQNVVDYQYSEITVYHYDVSFLDPPDGEKQETFRAAVADYTEGVAFVHMESVDATFDKKTKSAYLTLFAEESQAGDYFVLAQKGERIPYPGAGEAVVNSGLAADLGLAVGDTLTVSGDEAELKLTVSGIFDNYIYNYVFVTGETYEAAFGHAPAMKSALILAPGEDITGRLLTEEGVINVTASSVLRQRIGSIMDSLIYIVLLTIVCAAALAFIVIYNLTNININERMREIATVKVLGFYPMEAALYVLRENVLLTALGALAGIPLGIALNSFVVGAIKVDLVTFTPRILPASYLSAIALTLLFSLLVDLVMSRRLNRIDMAQALKAAE